MSQKYLIRIAELERLLSEQGEALRQKDQKLSQVEETEAFLRSVLTHAEEKPEEDAREVEHLWAQIEKLRLEVERVETQLNTANICHCITSECYSLSLFREYTSAVFRGIQRYLRRGNEQ